MKKRYTWNADIYISQLGSFWEYLVQEKYVEKNIIHSIKSEEFKPAKTNRRKMTKMPLHEDIVEMIKKSTEKMMNLLELEI